MPAFTPAEKRIYDVLSDGEPHTLDELKLVLDEQANTANLRRQVSNIRKKLGPVGLDILWQYRNHKPHLRLMRKVANPSLE